MCVLTTPSACDTKYILTYRGLTKFSLWSAAVSHFVFGLLTIHGVI